ncbi:hypothetical protein PROFUN_16712 [Planoprotostelium fungivorum]|uniref:EF-hand domain-containing protein n=1 Tax=Planoprotostelium fungivorum TaxID=1890364 RepID=A0A2P6MPR9_9EUKA|nr:hypothetical protein PROFUN_16712 [Planoprotostelium fungivorum]
MTSVPSLITSLNNALFVRSISIVQTGSPYKIAEIEQEKYSRVRMIVQNILDNWRVQFFKCIDQDGDGIVSIDYLLEQMEAKLEDCRPKFMLLRNIRECPAKTMGYNTFMSVLDNDRHFGKHLVVNSIHPLLHINPHQSDIKRGSVQREYGVIFKEWKQVWMVLTEDALYFYKQEIVDLRFCEAVEMTQTSFRLRSADGPIHIKTDLKNRRDRQGWLTIKTSTIMDRRINVTCQILASSPEAAALPHNNTVHMLFFSIDRANSTVNHLIHNAERMKRHREDLSRQKKTHVSKLAGELDS